MCECPSNPLCCHDMPCRGVQLPFCETLTFFFLFFCWVPPDAACCFPFCTNSSFALGCPSISSALVHVALDRLHDTSAMSIVDLPLRHNAVLQGIVCCLVMRSLYYTRLGGLEFVNVWTLFMLCPFVHRTSQSFVHIIGLIACLLQLLYTSFHGNCGAPENSLCISMNSWRPNVEAACNSDQKSMTAFPKPLRKNSVATPCLPAPRCRAVTAPHARGFRHPSVRRLASQL